LPIASINTGGTGKFDLTNDALVIRNSTPQAVQSLISKGFNAGYWNGPGIDSSIANADTDPTTGTFTKAIGWASNADYQPTSWRGVNGLTHNDVLVRFTYYGDATLDGEVTLDDFNQWLSQFTNPVAGENNWLNGDFDYSGDVTLDDFNLWLS